jgi:hypothetical protein
MFFLVVTYWYVVTEMVGERGEDVNEKKERKIDKGRTADKTQSKQRIRQRRPCT